MVGFKEIEKDVFRLTTSVERRKNSESPFRAKTLSIDIDVKNVN